MLLKETAARITLGGRSLERAEQAAQQLNLRFPGDRVSAVCVDAGNRGDLRSAFQGIDLVIVASPTTRDTEAVAKEALAAGADYIDIQMAAGNKLAVLRGMETEVAAAGRCFITEAGFHPGLPAALVRYLATMFDRLDSAVVAALLSLGGSVHYTESIDELMEVFRNLRGEVFREGRWRTVSWAGVSDMPRIDFGPPFGKRYTAPMTFEEMRAIPKQFPSLRRTGVYVTGFNWIADFFVAPVMMAAMAVSPEKASRPMGRLYFWAAQTFSSPPYGLVLKAEGVGVKGGESKTIEVFLSHEDGYVFTAIPVVACLLQYLDGSARKPGLWMMGHLVDPARLVADMERMGIRVRLTEGPGISKSGRAAVVPTQT